MPVAGGSQGWRKSSLSGADGCIEVRDLGKRGVEIRDSKAPEGPVLRFTEREWAAFTLAVRAGEFDTPAA